MEAAPESLIDLAVWSRNLKVMQQVDASLAAVLAQLPAPTTIGAAAARTRDGQINFLLPESSPDAVADSHPSPRWFGRTSIPRTRAEALLEQFEAGQANVLLPTMGEGTEAKLLLQRLQSHRAVFVWEPRAQAIQFALHLHDYEQAILHERLVLVNTPPEELTESLVQWLREHPGHLCPNRILIWPWQSLSELGACRQAVEAAYRQVEQERQAKLIGLRQAMVDLLRPGLAGGSKPSALAILSVHPRPSVWALSEALLEAARAAGQPAEAWNVRWPADVHSQVRATGLADFLNKTGPSAAALLLNITRAEVADVVPPELPALVWLGPTALLNELPRRLGPTDRLAVTDACLRNRAIQAGVPADRIEICPSPALVPAASQSQTRDIDVLIFADLPPTSPQAYGYHLASQQRVWNMAIELLVQQIEGFMLEQGAHLLERAERRTGTRLDDLATRQTMLDTLCNRVAGSMLWRFLVGCLDQARIRCQVYGYGWSETHGAEIRAEHPAPARQAELLRRSKVFLHADPAGGVPGILLTAAACGAVVCVRKHRLDTEAGGITSLLSPHHEYMPFARISELMAVLRSLLGDENACRPIAEAASQRCRAEHLPIHRLRQLISANRTVAG